jgi:CHCH domain
MPIDSARDKNSLDQDFNPSPNQHNSGQPLRKQLNQFGKQHSKFQTDCAVEHRESLACIEENYDNKKVCQDFFDRYRSCRREERERKLAENAKWGFWS